MRLIDADKLKAIIIEGYRKEFFGSVLWDILNDIPTVTKADICREFYEKLMKRLDYDCVVTKQEIINNAVMVFEEMEKWE